MSSHQASAALPALALRPLPSLRRELPVVFTGQLANQVLFAAASLAAVRLLDKPDYGLYTLLTSALGVLNACTDLGVSAAVVTLGAPGADEPAHLGAVAGSALHLRRVLLLAGGAIGACVLLLQPSLTLAGGAVLIAWCAWTASQQAVYGGILRLRGAARVQQRAELQGSAVRLAALVALVAAVPHALAALAANALAALVQAYLIRRGARPMLPLGEQRSPAIEAQLWQFSAPLLLPTLYLTFQSNITLWLLSALTSLTAAAELGALSRVGQITLAANSAVFAVLQPRLARAACPRAFRRLLGYALAGCLLGSGLLIAVAGLLVPHWCLWLLGPAYRGLTRELLLVLLQCGAGVLTTLSWAALTARGYTQRQWLTIPASLAGLLAGIVLFPPVTIANSLLVQLCGSLPLLLVQFLLVGHLLRREGA